MSLPVSSIGRLTPISSIVGMLLALLAGCDTSTRRPDPTPASKSLTPRESFAVVIQRFKRRYGGAAQQSAGIRTDVDLSGVRIVPEITHVIHEPDTVSATYTAEVTIRTKVHFTVRSELPPQDEPDPGEEPPEQPAEPPVELQVRTDEFAETYDLAYEDERWALKTRKLDESVRLAFQYALDVP